ncbi:MAG: chemotaxis signal transduction protein [Myxococcaceae bacterium]|nr:chemotaxis signal transduction protein [Myxococcaceae bacterium]
MTGQALSRIERSVDESAPLRLQYLTFMLGSELFAVHLETVREVIEYHGLTRIPLAPQVVPGVLSLRGAVVPVVDLRARIGRSPTVAGRRTCVVIIESTSGEDLQLVGVLVDSVSEALEVEPSQLERCPPFGTGLRSDFAAGMLKIEGRFVVVLEMSAVLSIVELARLVGGVTPGEDGLDLPSAKEAARRS